MNGVLKACFIDNLKKAAISKSNVSRKAIVSSEYRKAEHLLSMTTVPTSKSLLELVTRKRKKESSFGFSSLQQLEIPRELQMFTTSEYFMLYDSGPSADRVIVFGSRRCAEIMEKSEHLFIDGTFDAAPSLFYQMVSIHGKLSSSVTFSIFEFSLIICFFVCRTRPQMAQVIVMYYIINGVHSLQPKLERYSARSCLP